MVLVNARLPREGLLLETIPMAYFRAACFAALLFVCDCVVIQRQLGTRILTYITSLGVSPSVSFPQARHCCGDGERLFCSLLFTGPALLQTIRAVYLSTRDVSAASPQSAVISAADQGFNVVFLT